MPSPRVPSVGRVSLIVRYELLRTVRDSVSWSARAILLLGVLPLVLCLYSAGLGIGAYFVAPSLVAGEIPPIYPRAATSGTVATVAFFTLQRTIKQTGRLENGTALLVAVPTRDVVLGQVLAEYCRAAAYFVVPVVALAAGLALGSGRPLVGATVLAGGFVLVLLGIETGYALGLVAKNVGARSAFVAAHRSAIGIVATVTILVGYVFGTADPATGGALFDALARVPVAWVADLLLLPAGVGDPTLAAAGAAVLVVAIPVTYGVATRLAGYLWFVDPVQPADSGAGGRVGRGSVVERTLGSRLARPTTQVVLKSWRRAARAPFTVQYAVVPFFGLITPFQQAVWTGAVPGYLPAMLALSCTWATGAAFTLNPIGGEGATLPVVLTSNVPGRQFLGGLTLAAVAGGVPLAAVAVPVAGAFAAVSPGLVAAWTVAGVAGSLAAPPIAAGAGVLFPKFESTRIGSNREAIIPSLWSFVLYSLVLAVVATPSLVAAWRFPLVTVADLAGVPAVAVGAVGFGASGLLTAGVAAGAYLLATRRFGEYRLS